MRAAAVDHRTREVLPAWLGGAYVSPVAYQVVCVAFGYPPKRPPDAGDAPVVRPGIDRTSLVNVVYHLTLMLELDEADVLRAMAELKRKGVFEVNDR